MSGRLVTCTFWHTDVSGDSEMVPLERSLFKVLSRVLDSEGVVGKKQEMVQLLSSESVTVVPLKLQLRGKVQAVNLNDPRAEGTFAGSRRRNSASYWRLKLSLVKYGRFISS